MIRQLRWSDIDMQDKIIRWRAENEKTGYEHRTPITPHALTVLQEARLRNPRAGNAPVLPAPKDPSRCLDRSRVRVWWSKAQKTCRAGAKARSRLALPEAEVRLRPHEPATQGALRTGRLEDGPDRPPVLPAGRRESAQEGPRRTPEGLHSRQLAGTNIGNRNPDTSRNPMSPPGLEPGAYCLGGSRSIHLSYGDAPNRVGRSKRGTAGTRADELSQRMRSARPNMADPVAPT